MERPDNVRLNIFIQALRKQQLAEIGNVLDLPYMPLDVTDHVGGSDRKKIEEAFDEFLKPTNSKNVLLLLGDAGNGKSLSLKRLAYRR